MTAYGAAQKEIMHPIDFLYRLQNWQDSAALLMLAEKPIAVVQAFTEKSGYFITLLTCDLMEKLERKKFPHTARVKKDAALPQGQLLLDQFKETYMQEPSFEGGLFDLLCAYVDDPSSWINQLVHMPYVETRLALFLPDEL